MNALKKITLAVGTVAITGFSVGRIGTAAWRYPAGV